MKAPPFVFAATLFATALPSPAHDPGSGAEHPQYDFSIKPPGANGDSAWVLAQLGASPRPRGGTASGTPAAAAAFAAFAPAVRVRFDERFLYVESNGLPAHRMMVGITNWQQQVPLPQRYIGANAWQIPLTPVPAREPLSIQNRFLRGAIALAANGIPIFNPQNNRGEISQEIGELDEFGGHCGRADDYHYHAAPLHLQSVLGPKLPIAYALDGYAIYGLTEPDGSVPAELDAFHGHTTAALGYHYHASTSYPYVNGGFHGEVTERGSQVDPQPRATPVREAGSPLRGAKITGYETSGANSRKLTYQVNGEMRSIRYTVSEDGGVRFEYRNGNGEAVVRDYTARTVESAERERGSSPESPDGAHPPRRREGYPPPRPEAERDRAEQRAPENRPAGRQTSMDALKRPSASFILTSSAVTDGGNLPSEYTGDGAGSTLPLAWRGAPAGTQSYALIMDHLAPGDVVKSYWTMWDIPAAVMSLPRNTRGIGQVGTSFKGAVGYEPPHSQGPGPKTYVLTVYALSAPVQTNREAREVDREALMNAMAGKVLASASLRVVYTRGASVAAGRDPRQSGQ